MTHPIYGVIVQNGVDTGNGLKMNMGNHVSFVCKGFSFDSFLIFEFVFRFIFDIFWISDRVNRSTFGIFIRTFPSPTSTSKYNFTFRTSILKDCVFD